MEFDTYCLIGIALNIAAIIDISWLTFLIFCLPLNVPNCVEL